MSERIKKMLKVKDYYFNFKHFEFYVIQTIIVRLCFYLCLPRFFRQSGPAPHHNVKIP